MVLKQSGAVSFDNSSHVLSIATITYWYKGSKFVSAIPITGDIDTLSTLANNTVYFFYFDAAAGNTPEPIDPPTAEELQAIQDEVDAAEARAYTKLKALKAMTPSQVQAWVTANVKTLAQAQDAITTLAIGMSILARRI